MALTVLVYQRTDSPLLSAADLRHQPPAVAARRAAAVDAGRPAPPAPGAHRHRRRAGRCWSRSWRSPACRCRCCSACCSSSRCARHRSSPPARRSWPTCSTGDRYAVATSLTNVTLQLAQVVGFLLAGALVAVFDPVGGPAARRGDVRGLGAAGSPRRPAAPSGAGRRGGERRRSLLAGRRRRAAVHPPARRGCSRSSACSGSARCSPTPRRASPRRWSTELGQGDDGASASCWPPTRSASTVGGLVLARLVPRHRREALVSRLVVLSLVPSLLGRPGRPCSPGPARLPFAVVVGLLFVVRARRRLAHPAERLLRAGGAAAPTAAARSASRSAGSTACRGSARSAAGPRRRGPAAQRRGRPLRRGRPARRRPAAGRLPADAGLRGSDRPAAAGSSTA